MRAWIIVLVLFIAQPVYGGALKEISETKSLSNEIMQLFVKEEFTKGLNLAKTYWPLPPDEIDGLANQINAQWSVVRNRFGNPTGMEFYWLTVFT